MASQRNPGARSAYSDVDTTSNGDEDVRIQRPAQDRGWVGLSEDEQNEYANKLVRHMMCRHSMKLPVKRQELSKALFADSEVSKYKSSIFAGAMTLAEQNLRNIMGCEIVEIVKQTRTSRGSANAASASMRSVVTQTSQQTVQGSVGESHASQTSSGIGAKAYILVSTLPFGARPRNEKEWSIRAFLSIVASLILLEPGCRILEDDLYQALSRSCGIRVEERGGHRQLNDGNVKELMEKILVQQWYLEREKEDRSYYYMIGPRLRAELSDNDLLEFIGAVYHKARGETTMDATAVKELQQRLDAARGAVFDNSESSGSSEE